MKCLTLLISIVCIVSCNSPKNGSTIDNKKEVKAEVVQEQFTNKGGRDIDGVYDYFLKYENKKMFIKFMDSDITFEQIEPFIGKKATFEISERQGLWDTNDPEVQSRVGEYVVIWKIIEN